jgi:hypothetical protein
MTRRKARRYFFGALGSAFVALAVVYGGITFFWWTGHGVFPVASIIISATIGWLFLHVAAYGFGPASRVGDALRASVRDDGGN